MFDVLVTHNESKAKTKTKKFFCVCVCGFTPKSCPSAEIPSTTKLTWDLLLGGKEKNNLARHSKLLIYLLTFAGQRTGVFRVPDGQLNPVFSIIDS